VNQGLKIKYIYTLLPACQIRELIDFVEQNPLSVRSGATLPARLPLAVMMGKESSKLWINIICKSLT